MTRLFSGLKFLRALNTEFLTGIIRYLMDIVFDKFLSNIKATHIVVSFAKGAFTLILLSDGT